MSENKVEFLSIQTNVLTKIYQERVLDWIELGDLLLRKSRLHREEYRKKICASCSKEQKIKRKCVENTLLDGKKILTCGHMRSATSKKFKKQVDEHMSFHPDLNRVKIIQESEKIQSEIPLNPIIQLTK